MPRRSLGSGARCLQRLIDTDALRVAGPPAHRPLVFRRTEEPFDAHGARQIYRVGERTLAVVALVRLFESAAVQGLVCPELDESASVRRPDDRPAEPAGIHGAVVSLVPALIGIDDDADESGVPEILYGPRARGRAGSGQDEAKSKRPDVHAISPRTIRVADHAANTIAAAAHP